MAETSDSDYPNSENDPNDSDVYINLTPDDSQVYDDSNDELLTRDHVVDDDYDVTSGEYNGCTTSDTDGDEYAQELEGEADENILKNIDILVHKSVPLYEGCDVSMLESMLLILRFSLRYIIT